MLVISDWFSWIFACRSKGIDQGNASSDLSDLHPVSKPERVAKSFCIVLRDGDIASCHSCFLPWQRKLLLIGTYQLCRAEKLL